MSIKPEEMEELREDCIYTKHQDYNHKVEMRTNIDYFLDRSNYKNVVEELLIWKKEAKMYNRSIHELIDLLKDEL